jgi:hypothetical protein
MSPGLTSSVFLEKLTWKEAEPILRGDPLMVLPIGAAAKKHGPHLPLGTDRIPAEHLAQRLAERVTVVVMPTVTYGYYPHFAAVPGQRGPPTSVLRSVPYLRPVDRHHLPPRSSSDSRCYTSAACIRSFSRLAPSSSDGTER